ncbi:MAG TPA: cysteine synthase A [Firmicutes bacterium]|nr:cysteine synthase A [Bacillota bacterium]
MNIYQGIKELIGHTPLVRLANLERKYRLKTEIIAKLEAYNPAGSVKDRAARSMLEDAIRQGKLTQDAVIIEPTSGNTGIGLASYASTLGLRVILTMPETMSQERRNLLKAYGAELVLTPGKEGMQGAIQKAQELCKTTKHAFLAGQFVNSANPRAHYETTGPEIWEDTDGELDVFVSGIGTGGTISGTGKYLKEKNPSICIVAVEPQGSPVLSEGKSGPHGLQGIGAGFVPETLDTSVWDTIMRVTEQDAFETCREIAKREGILVGISSGAAIFAAIQYAKNLQPQGKRIVVLCPDSGERYLSTGIFG